MSKLYEVIGLGGTFDHFHIGHEHFLKFTHRQARHLHIGLTHPKLSLTKKWPELIQEYETRRKNILYFCKKEKISCAVSQISDVYGPTLDEESKIQALAVTEETERGAIKINQARLASGLTQLPVHVCQLLRDQGGQVISGERIRAGEINQQGEIFTSIFKEPLTLNKSQRQFFSQTQGKLITQPSSISTQTYVVGDTSLAKFLKNNWAFDQAVYDLKQQQIAVSDELMVKLKPDLVITNPAGTITPGLMAALRAKHRLIRVDGEEDLAAVALMLIAPLGSAIYYGQPNQGLVEMKVTLELKNEFYKMLCHH